jgi:hypothetical protein
MEVSGIGGNEAERNMRKEVDGLEGGWVIGRLEG